MQLAPTPRSRDAQRKSRDARYQASTRNVCCAEAVGEHLLSAAVRGVNQAPAKGIICVDDGRSQTRPGEELCLGCAVRRHRAVVVEMVARQVGEHRYRKGNAVHAALIEPVGRHFHHRGIGAAFPECGKHLVQEGGIGRGVGRGPHLAKESVTQRSNHRGAATRRLQAAGDPVGTRSLAVGTGHRHGPQFARRLAVDQVGDCSQLELEPGYRQMWHIPGSVPVEALRIPQHSAHAIRNRVANEGSSVEMRSWISREGVAGSDVAAIGSDPRDRRA